MNGKRIRNWVFSAEETTTATGAMPLYVSSTVTVSAGVLGFVVSELVMNRSGSAKSLGRPSAPNITWEDGDLDGEQVRNDSAVCPMGRGMIPVGGEPTRQFEGQDLEGPPRLVPPC